MVPNCSNVYTYVAAFQGGHSPGKPGKVRKFQSGQGQLRENGKVRETEIFILDFE